MHEFINSALCHLSGIREFLAQVYGVGNWHTAFLTFQLQIAMLFSCNSMHTLLKFSHSFGENFIEGISIRLITERRQQWKKNGFYFPSWQQIPSHHLPSAGAYFFGTDGPPAAQEIRDSQNIPELVDQEIGSFASKGMSNSSWKDIVHFLLETSLETQSHVYL